MIGSWELQQAIYTALTAGSPTPVPDVGARVYDDVPQNATYPFIEIAESVATTEDVSIGESTAGDKGVSEFIDLHVWSQYRGKKEAKRIMASIHTALHGVSLSVAERASALSWVRTARLLLDPDGVTRHGIVTVEVIHRN